jgi:hypothetical protein
MFWPPHKLERIQASKDKITHVSKSRLKSCLTWTSGDHSLHVGVHHIRLCNNQVVEANFGSFRRQLTGKILITWQVNGTTKHIPNLG